MQQYTELSIEERAMIQVSLSMEHQSTRHR